MRRIWDFLVGAVRDPITKDLSSSRFAALVFMCLAGLDVIVRLYRHEAPDAPALAALVGGGTVALLSRVTKQDSP